MVSTGEAIGTAQWDAAVEQIDSIGRTLIKVHNL